LDNDTAAAAKAAYNNTIAKLDFLQSTVSGIQGEISFNLFKINYATVVSHPLSHLLTNIKIALAATHPHQGFEILKSGCEKFNAFWALEEMSLLTKCATLKQDSFTNYAKAVEIVRIAEINMDLQLIEPSRMEKYTDLKNRFFLMSIHHKNFNSIFRRLTRDFGRGKADFWSFYYDLMGIVSSDYSESNECWTNVVYNGVENSRVKLQKFLEIVKYDCARAMHSIAVCGNVTYHNNPGSLNEMFNRSVHFALDISKQISEYVNKTVKLAYPDIMKVALIRKVGNNPVELSSLPALSTKIRQALNERDLPE
uniref:Uncharacterized protein n=1 Tax=Panagrolaimus sp. PS1159 TaxID=55785 RepID=A0AC35EXE9_9BILA